MELQNLTGLLGIAFALFACFLLSQNRRHIDWKTVLWGLVLQIALAVLVIRGAAVAGLFSWLALPHSVFLLFLIIQIAAYWLSQRYFPQWVAKLPLPWLRRIFAAEVVLYLLRYNVIGGLFAALKDGAAKVLAYSAEGASFVFGVLGSQQKMQAAFASALGEKTGGIAFIFAFQVLPTIIFVSAIFSVLYYLGVMQPIIRAIARFISRFLRASGAETLDVAANIFMGQTEAPLTIRPYLGRLTRSELFTIMVSGMAHCSAGILLVYVAVAGVEAQHLLASVVMATPGSIMLAKMVIPETETPETAAGASLAPVVENRPANVIDAAARGASEGMLLAANVAAMLIAFVALIALLNGGWSAFRDWVIAQSSGVLQQLFTALPAKLEAVLGWLLAPVAFASGVPWQEAATVGNLLGTRIVLNEFVGYIELGKLRDVLSPKAFLISTYLLCGFGNLSSIAIQAGGIGALIPERRGELAALGFLAVLVGVLSNILAASIAGLLF
ncbi:MAG: hypothetical protein N2Z22_05830 [Turneriella sp.]|nr:hypothetical protein [Turneriella sp.]